MIVRTSLVAVAVTFALGAGVAIADKAAEKLVAKIHKRTALIEKTYVDEYHRTQVVRCVVQLKGGVDCDWPRRKHH